MGSLQIEKKDEVISSNKGKSTKEKIKKTFTNELILGICSPIGSLKKEVISSIKKRLKNDYKYDVEVIKLSDFIDEYYKEKITYLDKKTGDFSKLMHKINGGDSLRKNHDNNSILVELAIKKIREDRKLINVEDIKGRRKCYIIDSLKNLDELKLLGAVYRDIFYLFSVFTLEAEQKKVLRKKGLSDDEVDEIISKDDFENNHHGQNVRNTFVNGDFFVRVSEKNKKELEGKICKYLHLIFDSKIITPNYDETAMYQAKSSAGNSACLSRQVGASITDENGIIVSTGWNDVPKFGGNLYNDSDSSLNRCKDLKYCSNVTHRNDIISEIKKELDDVIEINPTEEINLKIKNLIKSLESNNEVVNSKKIITDLNTIINSNGSNKFKKTSKLNEVVKVVQNSKFKNVIEYSRSIHAEMHAIIIGSQLTGSKMIGGSLYCTTYPCHNCARHIVLAGIKNIYYIEPYKKSLSLTLHEDSLTEDEYETDKVRILCYDGVSPRRYLDFYSMKKDSRKDDYGKMIYQDLGIAKPKKRLSLQAIPTLENQAIHSLYECGLIQEEVKKSI